MRKTNNIRPEAVYLLLEQLDISIAEFEREHMAYQAH